MIIKPITVAEVELIAFELAKKMMTWDEPIPDFGTRFPNILESCLAMPFSTFGRRYLYKGFDEKAAMLFYLMIKNHPFQNGNKRIAIMTLFMFLSKNDKWMEIEKELLYRTAVWVAQSPAEFKDQVVKAFANLVKKYSVKKEL
jgi:death on curing protein